MSGAQGGYNGGGYGGQYSPQGGYGGGFSGYGQPNRQYGGQMGMGLRSPGAMMDGAQSNGGGLLGAPDMTGKMPDAGAMPFDPTMPGHMDKPPDAGAIQPPPEVMPAAGPMGANMGTEDFRAGMAPTMGLQSSSMMAPQSQPQMGIQSPPAFGTPGNPWLTRQQLDAQSGDVNYGRPNPGVGDMGLQQQGGAPGQDAGAYPPGFQFERGNSTLDPRSMEFMTRWLGGSNSPWGPTQQQQVDGYNNWYRQQYPQNGGPGNGGM